eukprot:Awhi_evm1s2885
MLYIAKVTQTLSLISIALVFCLTHTTDVLVEAVPIRYYPQVPVYPGGIIGPTTKDCPPCPYNCQICNSLTGTCIGPAIDKC